VNKKYLIPIAVILIGALVVSGGSFPFAIAGFTTLGLSSVDFQSNDPVVGGQSWLLTAIQNGQGQYAVGELASSGFVDNSDGKKAGTSFKLEMTVDEQSVKYPISWNQRYVKQMKSEKLGILVPIIDDYKITNCKAKQEWYVFKPSGVYDTYCMWKENIGPEGVVSDGTLTFKSTIKATNGDGTAVSGTINSLSQTSTWLGNSVYVSWAGNLVSGDPVPSASNNNIGALYIQSQNKWITVDKTYLQSFNDFDITGFDSCIGYGQAIAATVNGLNDCVSKFNILAGAATSPKTFGNSYTSGSSGSGQITLTLNKLIQYPVMTVRIKADFLKTLSIVVPVGAPKVISVSSPSFQAGSTGSISATIQNTGTALGSFDVSASCSSGFAQVGTAQTLQLSPSQTGIVSIPLTANTGTSGTCTITARDKNNPSLYDSATVSVISTIIPTQGAGTIPGMPLPVIPIAPDLTPYLILGVFGAILGYAIKRDPAWAAVGGIAGVIIVYITLAILSNILGIFMALIVGGIILTGLIVALRRYGK